MSQFRKHSRWMSNVLQSAVLVLLVTAASYVTIGRILIGSIDQYRDNLESTISNTLAVPVTIGELDGSWSYFDPTIELIGLRVGESIQVKNITMSVDSIASLRERSLVLKGFGVEGARLGIAYKNEKWQVEGLPPSDKPVNLEPILTSIRYLSSFHLSDLEVDLASKTRRYQIQSDGEQTGSLTRSGETRSIAIPLRLVSDEGSQDFLLGGSYLGDLGADGSSSDLFLRLPMLNALEFLPDRLFSELPIAALSVGGDFWLEQQDERFVISATVASITHFEGNDSPLNATMTLKGRGFADGEVTAKISDITGEIAGVSWSAKEVGLAFEPSPTADLVAIQIPNLDIEGLAKTVVALGEAEVVLDASSLNVVKSLAPKGQIRQVMAVITLGETPDFQIVGELDNVSVQRYLALPVISELNGLVSIGPKGGFLDMVNERPFSLQFPGLFDQAWYFDTAKMRVDYAITDTGIHAQTGLVEATHGELIASGRVNLKLPGDPLETTWGLELGVQNADLLDAFRYLPNNIKDDIRVWLEKSILAGFSDESGMIFHGSLSKEAPKDQKVHQLYFEVEDTILDYDPLWPRFDELVATIFIDNFEISSNDAGGKVYDSEIFDSTVMVPVSATGVADTLLIDGSLRGGFSDGVRLLTETPLVTATNAMAVGWAGLGEMSGTAKMNIPLGDRAANEEPTIVDVAVALEAASLDMPQFDLLFTQIDGEFRYESNSAVTVDAFSASLFGQPVEGSIKSDGDFAGGEIIANLKGVVAAPDLYKWAQQPLLSRALGDVTYDSNLHVFYGNRSQEPLYVEASSKLHDVVLDLPMPMTKYAGEDVELSYKQIFLEKGYRIELKLGAEVEGNLRVVDDSLVGGRLHFGHTPMGVVSFENLRVSGEIAHVLYEEWEQLSLDLEKISEGSLEDELEQTLDAVEVTVGLFDVFGFEMENVLTRITRSPDAWHVDLKNEWMKGRVSAADDDDVPLDIAMQHLMFESELEAAGSDPLGEVLPGDLTAARFSVEQLMLDGEDYGSWSFLYLPEEQGAFLDELQVSVRGLQVADDSSVRWEVDKGVHTSHFTGTILVPDLAQALKEWGYASSIEGEDFRIYSDVKWAGSPAMVDLETIDGPVRLIQGEGRFVQADNNMGALRLLGMFDFASLTRRLQFDFADVVKSGFTFSNVTGEARFKNGIVDVVDPIFIEGAGSTLKVAGRVNLETENLDNDMIVILPVNRNLPWYAAYSAFATGPLTGAGVFLAQKVFEKQITSLSSAKYKITGTMDEPVVEFVSFFSDSVRDTPEDAASKEVTSGDVTSGESSPGDATSRDVPKESQ